jgi:hypothetical protein
LSRFAMGVVLFWLLVVGDWLLVTAGLQGYLRALPTD